MNVKWKMGVILVSLSSRHSLVGNSFVEHSLVGILETLCWLRQLCVLRLDLTPAFISKVNSNTKFKFPIHFLISGWQLLPQSITCWWDLSVDSILEVTSWFIVVSAWIEFTAIISRINPITVKRTVSAKQLQSVYLTCRYINNWFCHSKGHNVANDIC